MCIIVSKDRTCDTIPTHEQLENCFLYNRDGAGFMYVANNKVIIEKGYMKLHDFLNRFDELCEKYNNFKGKSLVIHCRIGTSSSNSPENTHPYAITTKVKNLHKTYFETDLGLVHNGIITSYTPKDRTANVNDTQKFILEYLAPVYKKFKTFYKMDRFRDGIRAITNSKFVFLDKNDRTYYVGDFINENGLKFSNSTYKTYVNYLDSWSSYNKKSNNFVDDYDDYDDEKYYNKSSDVKNDYNYDYFDVDENLIYASDTWYVYDELTKLFQEVFDIAPKDEDIVYSPDMHTLYKVGETFNLIRFKTNVTLYDEDFEEII